MNWRTALFAGFSLLAGRMGLGLLRLIPAVTPFVVRQRLFYILRGEMALASKMQNIICN